MKKVNVYVLMTLALGILSLPLEGASNPSSSMYSLHSTSRNTTSTADEEDEEYELLDGDEIDNSNTLAIPFDDSEIEDEEEMDVDERRNVFDSPHSR